MVKKHKIAVIAAACSVLAGAFCYMQCARDMEIYSSRISSGQDSQEEYLSVVINKILVWDKKGTADDIIKMIRDNSFHNFKFSTDFSAPTEFTVDVFLDRSDAEEGRKLFTFRIYQEVPGSNIYEHQESVRFEFQ